MIRYEYRVIPFRAIVEKDDKNGIEKASYQLETTINIIAKEGWDFFQLTSADITISPDKLASFFGSKADILSFNQLIFRRPLQ